MKVKWREYINFPDYGGGPDYDKLKPEDLYHEYEGEVIGTHYNFWLGAMLTVACTDKKIRSVSSSKVEIL